MVPTRLLILEDDDGIRTSMRLALEGSGYEVVEAVDAESALVAAAREPFDLMLVDLMLGGIDGFTFIQRIRPTSDVPIVVISARDDTRDIVAALEAGADDYVTKPFVVDEVKARLRALLRRAPITNATEIIVEGVLVLDREAGPLSFHRAAGVVRRGTEEIRLTRTEFRLLSVLAEQPGAVFSREVLLERIWERGFFGDERIVDVHVRRLRNKIEVDPSDPLVIVTVRGLGYRLDAR